MDIQLKHVPIGSTVELGGDTEKRRLYVGDFHKDFGILWKTKEDHLNKKPWQVMIAESSRVKNVRLPDGFDVEHLDESIRSKFITQ